MKEAKTSIRVCLFLDGAKHITEVKSERKDTGFESTVDYGYEDLDLHEDATKIELYLKADYITLEDNNEYKVTKRIFQPNIPVMLCLYLKKVEKSSKTSSAEKDAPDDMSDEDILKLANEIPKS